MKKFSSLLITILIFISFSFYSCASSDKVESDETESPVVENMENSETAEDFESDKESSEISINTEITPEIGTSNETLDEAPLQDMIEDISNQTFDLPDELEEPDVFEEENQEIIEETEILADKEDEKETEELINLDDLDEILPDITPLDEDIMVLDESISTEDDVILLGDSVLSESTTEEEDEITPADSEENKIDETENSLEILDSETISMDDTLENNIETETAEEEIIPSRRVLLKRGEYLDVIYPGNGWVYAGVTDGSKDVTYNGRKLGTENTTFTLIAKTPGTKIVHFYKTDNLTGEYIDDYLEIEISKERTTSKVHQIAPDYASEIPAKPEKIKTQKKNIDSTNSNSENKNILDISSAEASERTLSTESFDNDSDDIEFIETPVLKEKSNTDEIISEKQKLSDTESTTENRNVKEINSAVNINPEELLENAYTALNEKNFENALKLIEDYINLADKRLDEAYYLKGQIYEAQSGIQNINNAVAEYEKVIKLYPSSKYWDKANKRIIYLKRFYLEIR